MALLSLCVAGCAREQAPEYASSREVLALDESLQRAIRRHLAERCGTPQAPRLLGQDDLDPQHLRLGARVYQRQCAACHGMTGDGAGPVAEIMNPRPRDYRKGVFKFISTPYGSKPLRDDLVRTIRVGVRGTSMPSFHLLPDAELQAVVDYVLALTHRGELELRLAIEAENEGEIDPEILPDLVAEVLEPWQAARTQVIVPPIAEPPYTRDSVYLGKQAFLTEKAGCFKCHGADGTGRTSENEQGFVDTWGQRTKAADLTSGLFRGGAEPVDIYRRIAGGVNGTPMPSYHQALSGQPETIWHLVHYVQYVSDARRREVQAAYRAWRSPPSTPQQVQPDDAAGGQAGGG
ncbi:MAG: cytochrome c [Pirellulales bacterium]|nr:cytochrome c [Pirellulales bacterium]